MNEKARGLQDILGIQATRKAQVEEAPSCLFERQTHVKALTIKYSFSS